MCIVNRDLYGQLFANDESSDQTIRTLGTTFQVVGEFEKPVDTLGRGEVVPETILIPITRGLVLRADPPGEDALRRSARVLGPAGRGDGPSRRSCATAIAPGSVYEVESMTSVVRLARAISVALIVVFILAAAGVRRRRRRRDHEHPARLGRAAHARDRRAHVVGARRRDILGQFLFEALALGAVGGVDRRADRPRCSLCSSGALRARRGHPGRLWSAAIAFVFSCGVAVGVPAPCRPIARRV